MSPRRRRRYSDPDGGSRVTAPVWGSQRRLRALRGWRAWVDCASLKNRYRDDGG